jgi:hypothetical protein
MFQLNSYRAMVFLAATLALSNAPVFAAEGVVTKAPDASGNYCHLTFPAIREETLNWDRPVLKDPREGDIISFYGPCDYDPLGREEIRRQRAALQRDQHQSCE